MKPSGEVVVVDTSVVSLIFKNSPKGHLYEAELEDRHAVISFQTREELLHGALHAGWGSRRRKELLHHLEEYEVAWPDERTVRISADLRAKRKKKGRELKTADAWIAAAAISLGCPLVSDNGDFVGIENLALIRAPDSPALLPPEPPPRPDAG